MFDSLSGAYKDWQLAVLCVVFFVAISLGLIECTIWRGRDRRKEYSKKMELPRTSTVLDGYAARRSQCKM